MARLILSLGGQVLAEYNMAKERYTVGRLPDNDVRIDNPAVSGHHSLIINILNDSFLEDLSSTNGTYVNGKLVKKHALSQGDAITIGHHQLEFIDSVEEDDDEFARTMIIDGSQQAVHQSAARAAGVNSGIYNTQKENQTSKSDDTGQLRRPDPVSAEPKAPKESSVDPALPRSAKIQVLSGSSAGRELELNKTLTTLGRPGVQVIAITKRGSAYYIVQVDSQSGRAQTKVNGGELSGQAHKLSNNDVIELMGIKMGFFSQ
jgi:predicted component of type VI protein secretion system